MSKILYIGLISIAFTLQGICQDFNDSTNARKPLLLIKFAPLSLIDPDNTIQAGVEYLFARRWSIQQEVGYGNYRFNISTLSNNNLDNADYRDVWRTRMEVRNYFRKWQDKPFRGFYLALEIFYKRVKWYEKRTLGHECVDGDCSYFEDVNLPLIKDVIGSHFKIGAQIKLSTRFMLDFYGGLGVRWINLKAAEQPNGTFLEAWNRPAWQFTPTMPGFYRRPSMALGFKIGYLLYK